MTTNRPLDHLVLCVRDLEGARKHYAALGFTLTPRAVHPFGTANHLAQLQGSFLELLALNDPGQITEPPPGHFAFARYNQCYIGEREGMSMLVFASDDARRDQAEFAASGLETYAPFDFQRRAKLPDGQEVTVGFSLAFVTDRRMPDAVFFVCQQHAPQYFWKPEYQRHANGAVAVDEVVMTAAEPHAFEDLLRKLQPDGALSRAGRGLSVETARGRLTILDPRDYAARFAAAAPAGPPRFAAARIRVERLATAEDALRKGGASYERSGDRLLVPASSNFGFALEFAA